MRIAGSRSLPARPERVWAALTDADVLTIAVPGCQGAELDPSVRLVLGWRLAALDGVYAAGIEVVDAEAAEAATLRVTAKGEPGTLTATVQARLHAENGGTRLDWEAECEAADRLAAVGGRVLEAALRRQAEGLLDGVERHLAGPDLAAPPRLEPAPPAATSRPAAWGPIEDGPAPDTERLAVAALAGALLALLLVWVARRLRR